MFKKRTVPKQHRGFTLVEVLTVMLVLVAVASITVEMSSDLAFQNRYEVTKDRYQKIRAAIIGRPDVLINGQPDISGFVADVGRLPFALQELLAEGFCSDTRYFNQADCEDPGVGETWTANGYGWNGPYIDSTKAFGDGRALSDGWGNIGQGNYGWNVAYYSDSAGTVGTSTIANALSMKIQSLGKDGAAGGTDYDEDYPSSDLIYEDNWKVNISNGILLNTQFPFSGNCSVSYNSANSCEIAGGVWHGTCSDVTYINRYSCILNTETWTSAKACSNNAYSDQGSCEANGGVWDYCTGAESNPNTKLFCESVGGNWNFNTLDVTLTITHLNGNGGIATSTATATIEERGQSQTIAFNGFSSTSIPIGVNDIILTKSGTNDIYPPSCLGLDGDVGANGNSDCVDAGGVLVQNGFCDNITLNECLAGADGASGMLIRKILKIQFTPHKDVFTIHW